MNYKLNFFLAFILFSTFSHAQQITYFSDISQTKSQWNPAATGVDDAIIYSAHFRQQWVSFANAPRIASLGFEYPFIDYNMSIGANFSSDKSGPMMQNILKLNYAYKIKELLFSNDYISFGLAANITHFRFNPANEIFNDIDDPAIVGDSDTKILPNVSAGFYYDSGSDQNYGSNQLFLGFSLNQGIPQDLLFNDGNFERQAHYSIIFGNKLYLDESYLEASFLANFTKPQLAYFSMNIKFEMPEMMWLGAGYAVNNTFALNGGYIFKYGFLGDGLLRTGVLASYSLDNEARYFGMNYELYVAYEFQLR